MRAKLNHYIPDTEEIKTRKEKKPLWGLYRPTVEPQYEDETPTAAAAEKEKEKQEEKKTKFKNKNDFWYAENVKKSSNER